MNHVYSGHRDRDGKAHVLVDDAPLPIEGRHSPTGFEWGYGGSGPAELARAILRHHLDDRIPYPLVYQHFKYRRVARFEEVGFRLTSAEIEHELQAVLREIGRKCPLCGDTGYRQLPGEHEDACECALGRRLFDAGNPPPRRRDR